MRESRALSPFEPRTINERYAVEYLIGAGIWATPGKACAFLHCDVVALGCVAIEVKYARLRGRAGHGQYRFTTTPMQQRHGFRGELVMLVCDDGGQRTHHLFHASDPVFRMGGRVKAGFDFVPGRTHALHHGDTRVVMTQAMMDAARDRVGLVWDAYHRAVARVAAEGYPALAA